MPKLQGGTKSTGMFNSNKNIGRSEYEILFNQISKLDHYKAKIYIHHNSVIP
jgi:hypothetical protein